MGALKGIVIGLGILIVIGMVAVGVGIYQKTATRPMVADGRPAAAQTAAVLAPFGDIAVSIGEGCVIAEMTPDGGRLYLSVGPAGRCRKIIVVDVAGGRVLGTLKVSP